MRPYLDSIWVCCKSEGTNLCWGNDMDLETKLNIIWKHASQMCDQTDGELSVFLFLADSQYFFVYTEIYSTLAGTQDKGHTIYRPCLRCSSFSAHTRPDAQRLLSLLLPLRVRRNRTLFPLFLCPISRAWRSSHSLCLTSATFKERCVHNIVWAAEMNQHWSTWNFRDGK